MLCKGMEWTTLPVAGGIYDQHPRLIDEFLIIMNVEGQVQNKLRAEQQRKSKPRGTTRR